MGIRLPRMATGVLVLAAMTLTSSTCWAIYYGLGPSKDEWGLKYDVDITDEGGDILTVAFTLADEGRLKPFHSIELIAMSRQADNQGRRSYDVKAPFELKTTEDGKRAAAVRIRKQYVDGAQIRILTRMVDGQRQPSGGSYYDIPLKKFLEKSPEGRSPSIASPPAPPAAPKIKK
jgi:hypothetical protein